MLIRDAVHADWPQIYPIFAAIVREGRTYAYPEDLSSGEAATLWLQPPPWRAVVAVRDDGVVVGTALMGPNRPGRGAHVATASFMVDPSHRGIGVGRALGEHVFAWARETGFRGMQFNAVVETNVGALRLWESLGMQVVGTVPGAFRHPEHGYVGLHIMYQDLTRPESSRQAAER